MSMFWRVKQFFDGGGRLLKAEARLAAEQAKHAVVGGSVVALACVVALIGGVVLLAGAALALSTQIGWPWTLCAVGAVLLIGGLLAFAAMRSSLQRQFKTKGPTMDPVDEAAHAKRQMHEAVDPDASPPQEEDEADGPMDMDSVKAAAVKFVKKNPAAIASGAFVALSLIGPFRAIRWVAKGAALAGLAATVIEQLKKERDKGSNDSDADHSQQPVPASGTSAAPHHASVHPHGSGASTGAWTDPKPQQRNLPPGDTASVRTPHTPPYASAQMTNRRSQHTPGAAGGM
jgi:hypothetical protein